MKKLFFLLFILIHSLMMAQKFDYDAKWKIIEKAEESGLQKSNLKPVLEIFNQAKKENNQPQIIKSLIYQSKISLQISDDENEDLQIIQNFENEINQANGTYKAILQSLLAQLYHLYFQKNEWEINERTPIEESNGDDFRFWTENIYNQKIKDLYTKSIENKAILQNESIKNWNYILTYNENQLNLYPTIYDLLVHRIIADYNDLKNSFSFREISDKEENNLNEILKELTQFHLSKGNQNAYLYNQFELIKKQNLKRNSAEYLAEIQNLAKQFPNADYNAYLLFEIAETQLKQPTNQELDINKQLKQNTEKALATLQEIQSKFPKLEITQNAIEFENSLLAKKFNFSIEEIISPNQNTPFSITHKNTDKIYFKILNYSDSDEDIFEDFIYAEENEIQKEFNQLLKKLKTESEFQLQLKSFDDYQNHTTTARLSPLKSGKYLIIASTDPNFKINQDKVAFQYSFLNISAYALAFRNDEVLVTNRETGKPVPNVKVFITENYNRKDKTTNKTIITNELGIAKFIPEHNGSFSYKIEGENISFDNYPYKHSNERHNEKTYYTKFFSDRAIYRPGQTIYFKTVSYSKDKNEQLKSIENKEITISIQNPNGQIITELKLKTNEFGSASGEFIIPISGLTGNFTLQSELAGINSNYYQKSYSFQVEEYKRPKFEVKFDDVKSVFKLNEEITAHGKAMAYSGANIDNAKVTYRVYRQAIYPYLPWWKRGYFPMNQAKEEIAFGETSTNSEGKFEIKFIAKPASDLNAKTINAENARTYTYQIIADITDINGETRSSEQSITVGDLGYVLTIPIAEKIEISTLDSLPIQTQNLNQQFAPAKGKITLTKLNAPNRVLRNSPLKTTDYELYPKEEFISYFPHEPYGKENLIQNWTKEKPILEINFDTNQTKSIPVKPKNWQEGYYLLKGFIIDGKDSIPTEKLVYLYNIENTQPIDKALFNAYANQSSYQPGETAKIYFSSAAQNSEVLVQLEVDGEIVKSKKISLNNNVKTFLFPIEEKYRGNVYVHYYFGKFNTAQQNTLTIQVPFVDKSLKITAATLRDKLQPGQKETWELTISGAGKDKFLAEMLATMYDSSLDQFRANSNSFTINQPFNYTQYRIWDTYGNFDLVNSSDLDLRSSNYLYNKITFPDFNWFGFDWYNGKIRLIGGIEYDAVNYFSVDVQSAPASEVLNGQVTGMKIKASSSDKVTIRGVSSIRDKVGIDDSSNFIDQKQETNLDQIVARRALQETAFFYPNLLTDENGNIKIQFTTPESLTSWKFMATAHTPDLRTGYFETTVQTQKELMVAPNPPRFLREGDQITFSSKISNLSDKSLLGQAKLMLFDAFTMQPLDVEFGNSNATQNIEIKQGQSTEVNWKLNIPANYQAVVYRIVASAGDFSDGEESVLPILTNRMLITETLPLYVREGQEKTFTFEKLKNQKSSTLENFKLTFEMTTNPIWYAIFSLPYLREYPYECSEQVFSRLYGNLISQHLIHSNPKIKKVFDDWNAQGNLISKLEQNEELKALLLEETPWVRDAQSESEQMKRIAILFDLNKMQNELNLTFQKLKQKQTSKGGFPWFEGGQESQYITTHIVAGFGHLDALGINLESSLDIDLNSILDGAIQFIDQQMEKEFDLYLKNKKNKPSNYNGIQYLYARSYFLEKNPLNKKGIQIRDYFIKELNKDKFEQPLQSQAMLALVFHRFGKTDLAKKLLTSIKDNAVESDEMGMYWKSNQAGWNWYQAPIETQALLIEAFDEITSDLEAVESMKVWLLKNRQTNQWNSTKATTEAVFALMSSGKDWTNSEDGISVKIGNETLDFNELEKAPQSGSGYVKTSWNKAEIKPEMAKIEVEKTSPGVAWGAVYWQYFEDLDQITSAETNIKFRKELFLKKNSDKGPILTKITTETPIQIGDLVTVRLEIQTDRDMEFIHIKDMRASGFEPVNVLSSYKRQGKLGYYESTRDAATNFFIDFMPKGTFVFEYDVRANNVGNFSNGITTLQNMYAPEMSAHSEGIKVEIKN